MFLSTIVEDEKSQTAMTSNSSGNASGLTFPSTRAWFVVHILVPSFPFLLGCFIRFATSRSVSWTTFDPSDLAASLILVAAFVRQSLLDLVIPLAHPEDEQEVLTHATLCLIPMLIFTALFSAANIYSTQSADGIEQATDSLLIINPTVLIATVASLSYFIRIQRAFKLKARLK